MRATSLVLSAHRLPSHSSTSKPGTTSEELFTMRRTAVRKWPKPKSTPALHHQDRSAARDEAIPGVSAPIAIGVCVVNGRSVGVCRRRPDSPLPGLFGY